MKSIRLSLTAIVGICFIAQIFAVSISRNYVSVAVGTGVTTNHDFIGTSIPRSVSLDATISSDWYSRASIDYTGSGDDVTFSNILDQRRRSLSAFADGIASMSFTVAKDSSYKLSGQYEVDDFGQPGYVGFYSVLYDVTERSYLFRNSQVSESTIDESFSIGGVGGDSSNLISGSLTGALIAGHRYSWEWQALTGTSQKRASASAIATGFFQLDIVEGAPVPDGGSTMTLAGFALLALFAIRRRTK